jgi:hypothetical protein
LDEGLAPTQAGEDTPECQTIVKRYKNNKVGRGDFNAGTEMSPLTTTKSYLDEELSPTQAGEDTPECQTIVKRYKDNKGRGRFQRRNRGVVTNNN